MAERSFSYWASYLGLDVAFETQRDPVTVWAAGQRILCCFFTIASHQARFLQSFEQWLWPEERGSRPGPAGPKGNNNNRRPRRKERDSGKRKNFLKLIGPKQIRAIIATTPVDENAPLKNCFGTSSSDVACWTGFMVCDYLKTTQ